MLPFNLTQAQALIKLFKLYTMKKIILCTIILLANSVYSQREVLNFNSGWQFKKAQIAANELDDKYKLANNKWKLISTTSEETKGENGKAINAIDGNENTIWHTQWQDAQPAFPHSLIIDLGEMCSLEGFTYLARQNGSNGLIKDFELYLSDNLNDWGKAVVASRFSSKTDLQIFTFARKQQVRFVRFVALSSINSGNFASVAELGFIKAGDDDKSDWKSQFTIMHVENDGSIKTETRQETTIQQELEKIGNSGWENVTLPHTSFIEPLSITNQWEGISYYKKNFQLSNTDKAKKLFIEFEGAMQIAEVWLNGKFVVKHTGGYLPFQLDISDIAKYNDNNELLVRLDNRPDPLVPPGKPMKALDFCYHSGIYRDVKLIKTPKLYITDPVLSAKVQGGGVFVWYSNVTEQNATVHIKTEVSNEELFPLHCKVKHLLLDKQGNLIAQTDIQAKQTGAKTNNDFMHLLNVKQPKLWSPDEPNLYHLKTIVYHDDKIVDEQITRIGIRWFEFSRNEGFKLNGKTIIIEGTNRHQEYPYIGNALSDNAQYRDILKIKNAGFNMVRLGHYPQDKSVFDACDELGLLVENPIPGWQFFNNSDEFKSHAYTDIQQMIHRDRNHACIMLWEVSLNEAYPPIDFRRKCVSIAHAEFPNNQCFTAGDLYAENTNWDVPHNSWDEENKTRPQDVQPDRPGFVREYGDYEFGGHYSTTRQFRADGEQKLLQSAWNFIWEHNMLRGCYPWTVGDATWSMYDYNRGYALNICASGASDILRIPKFTYYFFQSQRNPTPKFVNKAIENGPMVYIANYWTPRQSPAKVVVFSNCDEVELVLNGKSIARQKPDSGPDSPYGDFLKGGNPFDSGNSKHLQHPPFTFNNLKWKKGVLKAVGYLDGKKQAEFQVRTPETPKSLDIEFDFSGKALKADGADVIFVYVKLKDKNGVTVPTSENEVTIEVTGEANIISPKTVKAEAGIATFLLQATEKPGNATLKVQSNGLKADTKSVTTEM